MSQRYRLTLQYDGQSFYGWQRLRDKPTVQGSLEEAIQKAFGQAVRVQGAGRTDRGAHALGQVAAFSLEDGPPPDELALALGQTLPGSVRVVETAGAPAGFHPRTAAVGKEYEYRLFVSDRLPDALAGRVWHVRRALDAAAMRDALPHLCGRRDFASVTTPARFGQKSTVRTLSRADLSVDGKRMTFTFRADSFTYHMVRNLVRLLARVGEGKLSPDGVPAVLAARDRSAAPGTAPASGLYLVRVFYPGDADAPAT